MTGRSIGALKRIGVLAVGAGVVASLAFAGPSYATNCQPDGRISGGGATFANNGFRNVFIPAYTREICRPLSAPGAIDANNEPNSGTKMAWYNWVGRPSGSTAGINGAHCRVDAYEASDVPFTVAQLGLLRGVVPASTDPLCVPFQGVNQQFEPNGAPWPITPGDTQGPIMAFPVMGGAVAFGFNLTPAVCGGSTPPASIQLDTLQASRLFGGQIATWNDAALVAIQPVGSTLANCTAAVHRFHRSDGSGTTTIFKAYLTRADGARPLCDGTTWTQRNGQAGNNLPEGPNCSAVTYAQGNPGVVNGTGGQVGGVGYGDLSDWRISQPNLGLATIRNATNTDYVGAQSGTGSNCSFAGATLPAGGANGAVNMAGNAWASDAVPNRSNVTFTGSGYPVCGFSWMLVRAGLGSGSTSVSRLTQNQRDTLGAFALFIVQPTTQAQLADAFYAPVPGDFLPQIRTGFLANYPVTLTP